MKKKNLLILALLAGALPFIASCSSDELVAENESQKAANEISFRPFVSGTTRAADMTAGASDNTAGTVGLQTVGFYVTAYYSTTSATDQTLYFDNELFSYNTTPANWTSTKKFYWPAENYLNFYAYAPATSTQLIRTNYKSFSVTPDATDNTNTQVDFIYAVTQDKTKTSNASTGVTLTFRHAESKISLKVKNTSTTLDFVIGNVSICNVNTVGTFTYTGETSSKLKKSDWTPSTAGNYTQTPGTTSFPSTTDATSVSHDLILIPQSITAATVYSGAGGTGITDGSYIKIPLKIKQKGTSVYIAGSAETFVDAIWPLPTGDWNPGYHYTYIVDLIGGGYYATNQNADTALDPILEGAEIKFVSVTVDTWSDGGNTNVTN